MVYGGSIRAGSCEGQPQLDIISAFQSYGKYLQDGKTPEAEVYRYNTVRHACPGPGACGGVGSVPSFLHRDTEHPQDVHSEHHGQRCRSSRDDVTGVFIVPRRIRGKNRRMQICWHRYAEPDRKKYFAKRYHDNGCFRKCNGASLSLTRCHDAASKEFADESRLWS